MGNQALFKPRDFIYMNTGKLDSYFSQLFGGLIKNVEASSHIEVKGKENNSCCGGIWIRDSHCQT